MSPEDAFQLLRIGSQSCYPVLGRYFPLVGSRWKDTFLIVQDAIGASRTTGVTFDLLLAAGSTCSSHMLAFALALSRNGCSWGEAHVWTIWTHDSKLYMTSQILPDQSVEYPSPGSHNLCGFLGVDEPKSSWPSELRAKRGRVCWGSPEDAPSPSTMPLLYRNLTFAYER